MGTFFKATKQFSKMFFLPSLSFPDDTTAKNPIISCNFLVWKFCRKVQFPHSFGQFAETMRKLCFSTKFPHQEIR